MPSILIVDDDKMICDALEALLNNMGHETEFALSLKEGLRKASSGVFDIVFLDVRLPDGNGLEAIPDIRETGSSPEIIIITGEGDPDGAELAVKSGAWDYIEKPLTIEQIKLPLIRAIQYREEKAGSKSRKVLTRGGIIGNSRELGSCFELLAQSASCDANILLTGETGTGKELFARAIHGNSSRKDKNFVVVDCAALPETLTESILFGHEKGAFTGAFSRQEGLIKRGDKGTVFLDEVGELPLNVQKSFLRVLQERKFLPVGGQQELSSDFRLIAATNRDLVKMVKEGHFRQDLYYRINAITIDLPPLRNRSGDINELLIYYLDRICHRFGIGTKGFSPEFIECLMNYDWPGNVREFINALEKSISAAAGMPTLFPFHLPPHIRIELARKAIVHEQRPENVPDESLEASQSFPKLKELLKTTERQYLKDLIAQTDGDINKICALSGLSRSRLYDRLKQYNIHRKL